MTTPSTKMGQPQNKNNSKLHTHSHTIFHIALFFLYDKTLKIGNVNQNSRGESFFKTCFAYKPKYSYPFCKK